MNVAFMATPLGIAEIKGDHNGVSSIKICDAGTQLIGQIHPDLTDATIQLQQYFSGQRTDFTFRLNPIGTAFQLRVWHSLIEIPHGTTTSYLQLSKKLGDPKAIRAVASANAKNPLWIAVPCHRVIGSNGSLTGFAGGLWRKKWLIDHECVPAQQMLF